MSKICCLEEEFALQM